MTGALELETLSLTGEPPKSRLPDATSARGILSQLINDDNTASQKRADIQGMIDGNPPYTDSDLKKVGRLNMEPNMNWGGAEARIADALTPHFDLLVSVPTYACVETEFGDDDKNVEWSGILTEEFDRTLREWRGFMYAMQLHQSQMVIHGVGPVFWRDERDWRFRALKRRNILVPRDSASDVDELEIIFIRDHMRVHELWEHIENGTAATEAGWDVEAAKEAIRSAAVNNNDKRQTWEWFQEKLKDNAYSWSVGYSKVVNTSHVYVKEFDGTVSHHLLTEEATGKGQGYLFSDVGVYDAMDQAVCVFFDGVGNGDFESVRGLGSKVYKFGQAQNRMNNALVMNATVGSCVMWQGNPAVIAKAQSIEFGPHRFMPEGLTQVQVNTGAAIQAGLQVASHFQQLEMTTTGSYATQSVSSNGKERTAEEVRAEVGEKSKLTNSKVDHYLIQMDGLYAETYRRLSGKYLSSDPGATEAKDFTRRCMDRGVPMEAIKKVRCVYASRPVGNGSPADRMMKYDRLSRWIERMQPRDQVLFLQDMFAAESGSNRLGRKYAPKLEAPTPTLDESIAALENSAMDQGDQVVFSPEQNAAMHLPIHVAFGFKKANDVQSGEDNPKDVAECFAILGPHMMAHLQQLQKDPTQAQTFAKLNVQVSELMKIADQVAAAAQQQQPAQPPPDSETMKAQADIQRQDALAQAEIKRKDALAASAARRHDAATAQHLALAQAKTQQAITHKDAAVSQDLNINAAQHAQDMQLQADTAP